MIVQSIGLALAIIILYLLSCIRILFEYQRAVVFRLGRVLEPAKGPGLIMVFWPIDRMVRVSLRLFVVDPMRAILEVEDYYYATSQLCQTTLRSIVGQIELDELLAEREKINRRLQEVIDTQSDPWGIKVSLVEVKHVDLPDHMQRAMAKQAESERERRAKVIHAEGEFQAAEKLRQAAAIIQNHPMAMQMRFLQTLVDVGAEHNTTIVFPVPIDLLKGMIPKDD
jgi:regulator of protease activity HflC (stomatin/prohibitin superfamily)